MSGISVIKTGIIDLTKHLFLSFSVHIFIMNNKAIRKVLENSVKKRVHFILNRTNRRGYNYAEFITGKLDTLAEPTPESEKPYAVFLTPFISYNTHTDLIKHENQGEEGYITGSDHAINLIITPDILAKKHNKNDYLHVTTSYDIHRRKSRSICREVCEKETLLLKTYLNVAKII